MEDAKLASAVGPGAARLDGGGVLRPAGGLVAAWLSLPAAAVGAGLEAVALMLLLVLPAGAGEGAVSALVAPSVPTCCAGGLAGDAGAEAGEGATAADLDCAGSAGVEAAAAGAGDATGPEVID